MSTNLSENALTLNDTSLTKDTLDLVKNYYYVPDNCIAGTTVILDGIECLCVATDVTIQGSSLRRIAVDKNHDLGYYQKYVGMTIETTVISQIKYWRWGIYKYALGGTSQEIGYGLKNTKECVHGNSAYRDINSTSNTDYPLMWIGVSDFIANHSDEWFVPSLNELLNYVYPHKSELTFDTTTGGSSGYNFWSSSEKDRNTSYIVNFAYGTSNYPNKYYSGAVRLCRAF